MSSLFVRLIGALTVLIWIGLARGAPVTSPFNGLTLRTDKSQNAYSFLVCGHVYGAPGNKNSQFPAAAFIANIDQFNQSGARFFMWVGDVVRSPTKLRMSNLKAVAAKLTMPIFNCPGNHDVGKPTKRQRYESAFGPTFGHFLVGSELFIMLDSELDNGQIKGEQLAMYRRLMEQARADPTIKNVFIFSHRLMWVRHLPRFGAVLYQINNISQYPPSDHFEQVLKPALIKLGEKKTVYWICGDVGVSWSKPLFYEADPQYAHIKYVATGIGDTKYDLALHVLIDASSKVRIKPISLTGNKVRPIEEYGLAYWAVPPRSQTQLKLVEPDPAASADPKPSPGSASVPLIGGGYGHLIGGFIVGLIVATIGWRFYYSRHCNPKSTLE